MSDNKRPKLYFKAVPHDYRNFESEIKDFYKAVRTNDHIYQMQLLRTECHSGLADTFKADYKIAGKVALRSPLVTRYWISYLYQALPSPNRKWSKEEFVLVEALTLCAFEDTSPDRIYVQTHLKELYKNVLQNIRTSKLYLIDLYNSQIQDNEFIKNIS